MKKRRRVKKKVLIISIVFFFLIGIGISVLCFSSSKRSDKKPSLNKVMKEEKKEPTETSFQMIMVGDALIHYGIYEDAKVGDGSYDFKPMLELTKPITTQYDLAYYNQETILGGVELGLSSYPRFNSPREVGDAFLDSGFNLVSLATNHTMDKGEEGVLRSLDYWKSKENVVTAGQYSSFDERNQERIYEINGIKYAFFSYTTWTNGLETPPGKEYLNNVYSNEKAQADIERVRDKVDIVMVAMHWGTEYYTDVSNEQQEIANFLSSIGVNIIIGTHPHVVEPVEYLNNGQTFVIYSLGNYISDQDGVERLTGLMMELTVKKVVNIDDSVTISIESPKAELVYTHSSVSGKKNFKVYPYSSLNNYILPNYMQYYEKYKGIVSSRYPDLVWKVDGEG